MKKDALFCVGQKAFIEKDGKVLVVWNKYSLDFPGGRLNKNEVNIVNKDGVDYSILSESLKREVVEETGLEIEIIEPFINWMLFRSGKKMFIASYKCKWLAGEVKLSDEHDKYEWVTKDDYVKFNDNSEYFNILEKYFKKQ